MIYLWVRKTTDWGDEATVRRQLDPAFAPKVDVWNATFTIPYHGFRERIKRIAQLNLSRVANARQASLDDVPDGAVVVPVDDDDWLAPDLGTVIEAEGAGAALCLWDRTFLELPPTAFVCAGRFVLYTLPGRPRRTWTCSTNNYAAVKDEARLPLIRNHMLASRYVDTGGPRVKRLPGRLSVMNRTLASQTSLGWKRPRVRRAELVRGFHRYRRLYPRWDPEGVEWCRPYLRMMEDLMHELRLR